MVERLFSYMNITKELLRNCLGDNILDILLRLNLKLGLMKRRMT